MIYSERENYIIKNTTEILKRYLDPEKIMLFGSRVKEKIKGHPDFDFAVFGSKNNPDNFKLNEELENNAGLYKIDVVFTEEVDEEFNEIIFKTGKIIYERGV